MFPLSLYVALRDGGIVGTVRHVPLSNSDDGLRENIYTHRHLVYRAAAPCLVSRRRVRWPRDLVSLPHAVSSTLLTPRGVTALQGLLRYRGWHCVSAQTVASSACVVMRQGIKAPAPALARVRGLCPVAGTRKPSRKPATAVRLVLHLGAFNRLLSLMLVRATSRVSSLGASPCLTSHPYLRAIPLFAPELAPIPLPDAASMVGHLSYLKPPPEAVHLLPYPYAAFLPSFLPYPPPRVRTFFHSSPSPSRRCA
ncbi:hypothetical protein FB451DRAFT_1193338 [Mycena latifolia]|nr:hypothetical protein FB451DRAFT_1193338 [Mycena latifolia]